MRYQVFLENVQFHAYHGLYPEEAENGNLFIIDLRVTYECNQTINTINETIDYTQLFSLLKEQMEVRRLLLETLADDICRMIKNVFPQILQIQLSIKKIHPPIEHFSGVAGVSIDRFF